MPLLNICGVLGNNMTIQIPLAFLSGEDQKHYTWALECLLQLLSQYQIPHPKKFVTDRELALLKIIDSMFPNSKHILCKWHVNRNVAAKCQKQLKTKEAWNEFYAAWTLVVNSTTLQQYQEHLLASEKLHPTAVEYCKKTWLFWKEKLVCLTTSPNCLSGPKTDIQYYSHTILGPSNGPFRQYCHFTQRI